ncbi:MAG: stage II sporulation protein M [Flavobacteriales bacterium]
MKEVTFLKKNKDKWKNFEREIDQGSDPDRLVDRFIEVTDDLSYAKTFYPGSTTHAYLNSLASNVHQEIYKNKSERWGRIFHFWKKELPMEMFKVRNLIFISFFLFSFFTLIGVLSELFDQRFANIILGDSYINKTVNNIESGDPMAIYKEMYEMDMFSMIALNNLRVSFIVFVMGIFCAVGTFFSIAYHGIMIGSFFTFFYEHEVLTEAMETVWIHGTLEIASIIVAGAAGLLMGLSLMTPKTYYRGRSLMIGAKRGIKVIFGIAPIIVLAAFLEAFVTRHTEMPSWLSLLIIGGSLGFVIWYLVIYPIYVYRNDS